MGGITTGVEATGVIDRREFGIVWELPGEGAGVVVGDPIQLTTPSWSCSPDAGQRSFSPRASMARNASKRSCRVCGLFAECKR